MGDLLNYKSLLLVNIVTERIKGSGVDTFR